MSDTTYRIGGAMPATACVRHQGAPVAFQCQDCLDSLCEGCRAPGRQNRCLICHEALEQRDAGGPVAVAAQPPRSRWRAAIVGLILVNAALAATWIGTLLLRPVPRWWNSPWPPSKRSTDSWRAAVTRPGSFPPS